MSHIFHKGGLDMVEILKKHPKPTITIDLSDFVYLILNFKSVMKYVG
jgi:hypothetical protein